MHIHVNWHLAEGCLYSTAAPEHNISDGQTQIAIRSKSRRFRYKIRFECTRFEMVTEESQNRDARQILNTKTDEGDEDILSIFL